MFLPTLLCSIEAAIDNAETNRPVFYKMLFMDIDLWTLYNFHIWWNIILYPFSFPQLSKNVKTILNL